LVNTPKWDLKKFEGNDLIKRQDFNDNWDKIDVGATELDNKIDSVNTTLTNKTNTIETNLNTHINDKNNPHVVTAEQIGAVKTSGGTISGNLQLLARLLVGNNANIQEVNNVLYITYNAFYDGSAWRKNTLTDLSIGIRLNLDGTFEYLYSPANQNPIIWNNYIIWNSKQQGHNSGLDADTVDGKHFEDMRGYSYEAQGYCQSGQEVQVNYSDYKVSLIPFINKFPNPNIPYFPAPTGITLSGGEGSSNNTYLIVKAIAGTNLGEASNIITYTNKVASSNSPIIVSFNPVAGATAYRIYGNIGTSTPSTWNLIAETTNTSYEFSSIPNNIQNPFTFTTANQRLRIDYTKTQSGFIPYMENYRVASSTTKTINQNVIPGSSYTTSTSPDATTYISLKNYMNFTINWSGFSGSCTWGISFKVQWRKQGGSWIDSRTYSYSESWGSQWVGGSKSYSLLKTLILNNLEQDIYEIQIYDITVWKNNDNFWFTNVAINVNSLTYMVDEKVEEYNGIYQIFIK
jgi:hypothetical protein